MEQNIAEGTHSDAGCDKSLVDGCRSRGTVARAIGPRGHTCRHHLRPATSRPTPSASDPAPLSLDGQLADLVALLEAVAPDPPILVGHSWGGLLAQLVAWSRPGLVRGLLLLDPSHERFWLELTEPTALRAIGHHPDPTQPATTDPRSGDLLSYADRVGHDVAASVSDDPVVRDLFLRASRSYLATDEQLRVHLDEVPMIVDQLETLTRRRSTATWPPVPTVILTATKGRPVEFVGPVIAIQERVAANAQHIVVPDAGHYIHVDRPDLVARLVRDIALSYVDTRDDGAGGTRVDAPSGGGIG
jgi:pimeloyl-ACP methyl ester carboxylesterase